MPHSDLISHSCRFPHLAARGIGSLAAAVLVTACSGLPTVCTDELGFGVRPSERTLAVGESFTPEARATTCSGRETVDIDWEWSASDTTVVRVDARTGRTVGLRPGEAVVIATESPHGGLDLHVQVRVVPPAR